MPLLQRARRRESRRIAELLEDLRGNPQPDLDAARKDLQSGIQDTPFMILAENAGLSAEELETLALCVAVEADVRRQRLVGWLHDDQQRPGSALISSEGSSGNNIQVRSLSVPGRALRGCTLDVDSTGPWGARSIRIEPAVMWALAGEARPDPELPNPTRFEIAAESTDAQYPLVFVTGPDRARRRSPPAAARRRSCSRGPTGDIGYRLAGSSSRATLRGAGICIEATDDLPAVARHWIEHAAHIPWAVVRTRNCHYGTSRPGMARISCQRRSSGRRRVVQRVRRSHRPARTPAVAGATRTGSRNRHPQRP